MRNKIWHWFKRYIHEVNIVFLIITMVIIFILSHQPSDISHELSNNVADSINIKPINRWSEISSQPVLFGLTLRKIAHIILYAIMGTFSYFSIRLKTEWTHIGVAFMICYGYAIFDEIHQYFIPGRTAGFTDTIIDAIGFISTILISDIIRKLWSRKHNKS